MRTTGTPAANHVSDLDIGLQRQGDHDSVAIKLAIGRR
jgi:hypothetical protein